MKVTFGSRIRSLADRLKIEEQQLAKDLGLTKSQLSHYIKGRRKVPSDLLQKIIDTYKINPLFLFNENEPLYKEEVQKGKVYDYYPTYISAGVPNDVEAITKPEK